MQSIVARPGTPVLLAGLLIVAATCGRADELDEPIAQIAAVGPEGRGSQEARRACRELAQRGPASVPRLLAAMDTTNAVAANWYRAAYEEIVARELARSSPRFPRDEIKAFIREPKHAGRARRLALVLLDRLEPAFGKKLLPELLDDPEFRDDAVAIALARGSEAASSGNAVAAKSAYRLAFQHARTAAQVTAAAAKLESLGEKAGIVEHLGFVTRWQIIGPFDAPGTSGFRKPFPPESAVDLASSLPEGARQLRWKSHQTNDPLGTVDLVPLLGPQKECVAYAYAEVESDSEQDGEIRCSADDCLAVWLDGRHVAGREMWLNGTRLDRFTGPIHLKRGRNRLLVKACQGPQHRDPAVGNAWTFQLRICAADGAGLQFRTSNLNIASQ
jgi:hypothetical protein